MPNFGDLVGVGGDGHEVLRAPRAASPEAGEQPFPGRLGVGDRLQGGEGLRADDEKRLGRVEVALSPRQMSAPSTLETKRTRSGPVGERQQRLVRHGRPEVRAADADVDDVLDPLAGEAAPLPAAHASANAAILSSTPWTLGHDVLAVDDDRARPPAPAGPRAARPGPR